MNYFIITGTSRGLGEAIAFKLIENKNNHITCISRKSNKKLIALAEKAGNRLNYLEYDLNEIDGIFPLMDKIFSYIDKKSVQSLQLINNAGILSPIKPIEKSDSQEIVQNLQVNLTAPILLTSAFIQSSQMYDVAKKVINISSGAGKNPYDGWSCYCSSKSGLDMFTRCVGLEQQQRKYPVKILSVAPGVVDTEMQSSDTNH